MSNFQDIYRDFPSRVCEVWQRTKTHPDNEAEDRSVTAMLMTAAAGFAMPWENLKEVGLSERDNWNAHPAFDNTDQSSYRDVLKKCAIFFKQKLHECESLQDITFMHCQELADIKPAAENVSGGKALKLKDHNVRCAIRIFRNALAHNNIAAIGTDENHIQKLVFFSENRVGSGCHSTRDGWLVLTISVQSFGAFLDAWFLLLAPPNSFAGAAKAFAS